MKEYKKIQIVAYGKYQLDWMIKHGCSLNDLWKIFTELATQQIEDDPDDIPINGSETELFADMLRNRFLNDVGFSGSLFACMDEFLETEYLNTDYMRELLTADEYTEYLKDISNSKNIQRAEK